MITGHSTSESVTLVDKCFNGLPEEHGAKNPYSKHGTPLNRIFLLHNHWFKKKLTKAGSLNMMVLWKKHRLNGPWTCVWASWALHIQMVEHHGLFWTILYVVSILDAG